MSTPKLTTRQRIVEAAFDALRTKGFSGASARAIAANADVNAGLLFYYFDSVDEVLLEALRSSSEDRLERYREAIASTASPAELIALLRAIYDEDRETGHIRVVSEMVAGSVSRPELGARVMELLEPWLALAEEGVERAMEGSPLAGLVPPRQIALAGVTFYLGANLVTTLSDGRESVDDLFETAERGAELIDHLPPATRAVLRAASLRRR